MIESVFGEGSVPKWSKIGSIRSQAAAKPLVDTGSSLLIFSNACANCGRNVSWVLTIASKGDA